MYDNKHIHNLNHLKDTLIELNCSGEQCGLNQNSIPELTNLEYLDYSYNKNIDNVNHMNNSLEELRCNTTIYIKKKLCRLDCGGLLCGICRYGIDKLTNLKKKQSHIIYKN